MLIDFMEPDFVFENGNYCLKQLVHDGWRQVNVVTAFPGNIRGGHYHKYNREAFYVVKGRLSLTTWKGAEKEEYEMKEGDLFVIHPNVFHTFVYEEETILVSMYSQGVEISETEKDIWNE